MAAADISDVAARARSLVGSDGVLEHPVDLLAYRRDASKFEQGAPDLVLMPRSTEETLEVVRLCRAERLTLAARGAGTGLVGGCLIDGGAVVSTSRMRHIADVNAEEGCVVVEAGVVLDQLNSRLNPVGLMYSPDPFSSAACTIGGSVATNARGPRSLRYGDTRANLLGLEVVLWDGKVARVGMGDGHDAVLDLLSQMAGGEGTLGVITRARLRLVKSPVARDATVSMFAAVSEAIEACDAILESELTVSAMELMDRAVLDALEPTFRCRFPQTTRALLLVEFEGSSDDLNHSRDILTGLCRQAKAREVRESRSQRDMEAFWAWRHRAVPALERLSPTCWVQDVLVPRNQMADAIARISGAAQGHAMAIGLVAHAGNGFLHPVLMFDALVPDQMACALQVRDEIFAICDSCGGSIRGEHGLGREKAKRPPTAAAAAL